MHSDLLAMVLLQFRFYSDHLLTVQPLASFPPVILTLLYFFPLVHNNSITCLLILFSYKSRSPGFSSSSTLIHPSILGLTVMFQEYCSWANLEPSCRNVDGASCSLFHHVGRWQEFLLCVFNRRALGTPVQVWCVELPVTKSSSHHRLYASFPFPKNSSFPPTPILGPEWLCCRVFSVLSLNRCE